MIEELKNNNINAINVVIEIKIQIFYSSSRNTRVFRHEIRAQSETRLHREYNLAMKNKSLRRIAAAQRRRCFAPCAARQERRGVLESVTETAVDGYKDPSYGVKQESDVVIRIGGTSAEDGQYIINTPQDAVSLPKTGGPGTKLLYSMGTVFTAMAGFFLFLRRRRGF